MTTTAAQTAAPDRERFCTVMSQLPTGVAVITTAGPDGPVGCTANALLSLSTEPPSVLVSLASAGRTARRVIDHGGFAVNVLSWQQRELSARFARLEPHRRFEGVDHRYREGCPVLDGTAAALVCRLEQAIPVLDHTLLIGRPLWTHHDPEAPGLVLCRRREHAVAL